MKLMMADMPDMIQASLLYGFENCPSPEDFLPATQSHLYQILGMSLPSTMEHKIVFNLCVP